MTKKADAKKVEGERRLDALGVLVAAQMGMLNADGVDWRAIKQTARKLVKGAGGEDEGDDGDET